MKKLTKKQEVAAVTPSEVSETEKETEWRQGKTEWKGGSMKPYVIIIIIITIRKNTEAL